MDALCCAPIFTSPISKRKAADVTVVLKALADPVRLRLVSVVATSGEACARYLPALWAERNLRSGITPRSW